MSLVRGLWGDTFSNSKLVLICTMRKAKLVIIRESPFNYRIVVVLLLVNKTTKV